MFTAFRLCCACILLHYAHMIGAVLGNRYGVSSRNCRCCTDGTVVLLCSAAVAGELLLPAQVADGGRRRCSLLLVVACRRHRSMRSCRRDSGHIDYLVWWWCTTLVECTKVGIIDLAKLASAKTHRQTRKNLLRTRSECTSSGEYRRC